MKSVLSSSKSNDFSIAQFMETALTEVMDAIESKPAPGMLTIVKSFREKLGKKNGLSPEMKAEVIGLLKEIAKDK